MRILFVTSLGSTLAASWISGLSRAHQLAVADWRALPATPSELKAWGVNKKVTTVNEKVNEREYMSICSSLEGEPELIFAWWGSAVLPKLAVAARAFPRATCVLCVDTLPNAAFALTEAREVFRFRRSDPLIAGYIFYSELMRDLFYQRVPSARVKPYLTLIEPFPRQAYAEFAQPSGARLERVDESPHVIFTGRTDYLWSRDPRMRKDAVGPILTQLATGGINVFLPMGSPTRGLSRFHIYPRFSSAQLFEGDFARYVSQFDAHLVLYNECNATVRRRVSTGLATRLAFALTATSPPAVSSTARFIREHSEPRPFCVIFDDPIQLAEQLYDTKLLLRRRTELSRKHIAYAYESNEPTIKDFLSSARDFDSSQKRDNDLSRR